MHDMQVLPSHGAEQQQEQSVAGLKPTTSAKQDEQQPVKVTAQREEQPQCQSDPAAQSEQLGGSAHSVGEEQHHIQLEELLQVGQSEEQGEQPHSDAQLEELLRKDMEQGELEVRA